MKLNDLINKTFNTIWGNCTYWKTVDANLKEAVAILSNPDIKKIDTLAIDGYISSVSKVVKPSTVNRKLSNLHTILKYAHDRDLIVKLPKFTWKKEDNERIRWVAPEEEATLLSLLSPEVSAFCEVLIHTGMRRGELLGLKPEDVDGSYARLWKTKTGKARSVPLSERAKVLLKQYLPFTLTISKIQQDWSKAKKEMGLGNDNNFVLHTLRHTTASRLLNSSNNIAIVQRMLGHAKITTTMRYAHISDEQLLDAIKKVDTNHATT